MSEINLMSKSDKIIAILSAELSRINANVTKTLVVWQTLVGKEKQRDELRQANRPTEEIQEMQATCDVIANELFDLYQTTMHENLLDSVVMGRIFATLIERLAEDYSGILEKVLSKSR